MSGKSYSFKLGAMEGVVLLDGTALLGSEGILKRYPAASEAEYRQAFAEIGLSLDEADSSYNILLMKTGEHTILVDSGQGGRPTGGLLPESLKLAGIAPETITLVVITHSHGDHVLGLLTDAGGPAFPNATYVISGEELAFWQSRISQSMPEQQAIVGMMEAAGLRRIAMDEPILPGVTAYPIPGHTPGQIALIFESQAEKLIHMADLLHSPMQFAHPEWSPTFDADTGQSVPSRRAALSRAAGEDLLAMFYHLSFPGLGWVKADGEAFRWERLAG